jgi:hypothetical protein
MYRNLLENNQFEVIQAVIVDNTAKLGGLLISVFQPPILGKG